MDSYLPIARKYRPKTFKEVLGQDAIVTTLKNSMKLNRVGSCYLFCGTRGTGKTTLARLFARTLNCSNLTRDLEPCNSCASCLEMLLGKSMDLVEIDGASNRGIDDIRALSETLPFLPTQGRYRIFLIDEVHMLTKEAFNALLKTLEEPPSHIKFFFATTEPQKIPTTILSRCQKFDLFRIQRALIEEKLQLIVQQESASAELTALQIVALSSEGSLRDAESLLDRLLCESNGQLTHEIALHGTGRIDKRLFFPLDEAFDKQAHGKIAFLVESWLGTGIEGARVVEELIEHFKIHLLIKEENFSLLLSEEERRYYFEQHNIYSIPQLLSILDFLYQQFNSPTKPDIRSYQLETILLLVLKKKKIETIELLIDRLEALETRLLQASKGDIPPPQPPLSPSSSLPLANPTPLKETPIHPAVDSNEELRRQTLIQFALTEWGATLST